MKRIFTVLLVIFAILMTSCEYLDKYLGDFMNDYEPDEFAWVHAVLPNTEEITKIELTEDGIIIHGCSVGWCFAGNTTSEITFGDKDILLSYNGFDRTVGVHGTPDGERSMIHPEDGYVGLILKR